MTYTNSILMLLVIMAIFTGEYVTINTIIITLIAMAICLLMFKIKNKKEKIEKIDKLPIGYFLSVSNIIIFLLIIFLIS